MNDVKLRNYGAWHLANLINCAYLRERITLDKIQLNIKLTKKYEFSFKN